MNQGGTVTGSESLAALAGAIAAVLADPRYPASELASLRRYSASQAPSLAFYRLWLVHLDDELPTPARASAWALIACGLACSGSSHNSDRPLGSALAAAGYSELRLESLLASRGVTRHEMILWAFRFMASKREHFDWADAARLLLTEDATKLETIQRRIATQFYRERHRQGKH